MRTANLLRHARRRAGLTQVELAALAGVPQSTVGRIETDRINPTMGTLRLLLNAAGQELELSPLAGQEEDRSLIRDRLELTPAARARLAIQEARFEARLRTTRA